MNRALRTRALPAAALAATLALSACGSSSSGTGSHDMGTTNGGASSSATTAAGAPARGAHNDADVTFATDMIPHHAQAITMADMALAHATNTEVKALATAIKGAQNPEIRAMSGWLTGWGKPVPQTTGHNMSTMGGGSMNGMMSDQEMGRLGNATGSGFDRMWLQMMTRHHQGAVAMAKTELAQGTNGDANKLAQAIIDGQTKEIAQMRTLLGTLAG